MFIRINYYSIRLLVLILTLFLISCAKTKMHDVGQIITPRGEVLIWLYNETPNHKESFMELANNGYWDSFTFNRVIPNFVAQGGCPDTPEGFTDSEYLLDPEFNDALHHEYGEVGAGRDDNPGMVSARCQFYVVQNKEGIPRLDNKFTIFGKVIKGMDVINSIVNVERDSTNTPLTPITLDVNMICIEETELRELYPDFN